MLPTLVMLKMRSERILICDFYNVILRAGYENKQSVDLTVIFRL